MHFLHLAFGNESIDSMMSPYVEELDEPVFCCVLGDNEKGYLMTSGDKQYDSFDEYVKDHKYSYQRYRKNDDGEWEEWTILNPNAQYDWYVFGGRWTGHIVICDNPTIPRKLYFNFFMQEEERKKLADIGKNLTDVALIKDIVNAKNIYPYSFILNGEWYNNDNKNLSEIIKEYNISEDTKVTVIDCHI